MYDAENVVGAPDFEPQGDGFPGVDLLMDLSNHRCGTLDLVKCTADLGEVSEFPVKSPEQSVPGEQRAFDDDSGAFPEASADTINQGHPETGSSPIAPSLPPPESSSVRVEIPECALLTPRSYYEPFEPPVLTMPESQALATLASVRRRLRKPAAEFVEYNLDEFAVYCDTQTYPCEMRPLHHLDTKLQLGVFFFDGVLSVCGQSSIFVRRVPIFAMPIDNYGDVSKHTVQGDVWLQSALNRHRNIYYRLGKPAKEYSRFYHPSLWVADLAKHFVDFLKVMEDHKRKVSIRLFSTTFCTWLKRRHKNAPAFLRWLKQHPCEDFRTAIAANLPFLHKEAIGVLGPASTYFHMIWSETWNFSRYKVQPAAASPRTVVTQYTYDCFKHMPFGDQLEVVPISAKTKNLRNRLIRERHLELPAALHESPKSVSTAPDARIKNIKPGDTISTHRDGEQSGTMWKREVSRDFNDVDRWFALVQEVYTQKGGKRAFDVIWYYRPVDTLCGLMKYPWNNELFLSDHCSCPENHKIGEDEVLGVHDVEFGATSATNAEFFCRQTYVHEERKWVTLDAQHRWCEHTGQKSRSSQYRTGDTLLVCIDAASGMSEPCELVISYMELSKTIYRLRRLLRRIQVDPQAQTARPNELVYSELFIECGENRIVGRCHVRFFAVGATIPPPYDRDGVGGCFYLGHQQVVDEDGVSRCVPLESGPTTMRQGYDPEMEMPKLRGIDLFCGGGNFGRGLEEGGGIQMNWANDYDSKAMHTYMANLPDPEAVTPFLGSIDDLQRLAIKGNFSKRVPAIGDVDFVSAGSPCPGFSQLTNDKTTVRQRKNQSLVAAFASFVDLYRPKYGLLENVPGIVHKHANRDQDVFSQLICAAVGLGYQTQFFFLDASSCGSPQRRSRVFLAFAAPGYKLPGKPLMTHSHPPKTRSQGLGMLPTGEPMAVREMPRATPFKFVTAEQATSDLPAILDAKPDICVPFPDHRVSLGITRKQRTRISLIPNQPWGINFAQAWFGMGSKRAPGAGILTPAEHALFVLSRRNAPTEGRDASEVKCRQSRVGPTGDLSNAYGRLYPHRLMETIVTANNPCDGKNGRSLHWREDRIMTIMEARRAQGVRDDEVLLGNPATQYKIVGNSVAREVAVALGIVFREAWAESLEAGGGFSGEPIKLVDNGESVDEAEAMLATEPPVVMVDDASAMSEPAPGLWSSCGSSTPATTIAYPSPTPSQAGTAGGVKRQMSLTVEIRSPKRRRSESPKGANVMGEPSPLGKTVVALDDVQPLE
ncbi:c-5 cytosine-specific DNA methylase domain-containing protein [Hirsutella rhossiliensis]|uniref:DNA (cytosine-5-)-methyltransferase n=1 Tax=Hirsutella rhossiliensis TaxID=111463 RepID=A0A9P8SL12_9HYPO|nr:c-5 cytosine-specific DNA methylase domain-containing protein [Hirsutella rhossiliensis]KAH0964656.1 c-5 cytosine-specific DNA methylase domain-containing protein [Hirsutella rhossiliensis]